VKLLVMAPRQFQSLIDEAVSIRAAAFETLAHRHLRVPETRLALSRRDLVVRDSLRARRRLKGSKSRVTLLDARIRG